MNAPALVLYYNVNSLFSAATTTCQTPVGYTYKTSVDKYYKPVKDNVTWNSAIDACSSEGSMLVELRTLADYQAIRQVFGMSFNIVMI